MKRFNRTQQRPDVLPNFGSLYGTGFRKTCICRHISTNIHQIKIREKRETHQKIIGVDILLDSRTPVTQGVEETFSLVLVSLCSEPAAQATPTEMCSHTAS